MFHDYVKLMKVFLNNFTLKTTRINTGCTHACESRPLLILNISLKKSDLAEVNTGCNKFNAMTSAELR